MGQTGGVRPDVVVTMGALFGLRPGGQSGVDLAHHSLVMLQEGRTQVTC